MKELNIERNRRNGGYCCYFTHNGKEYYADVCVSFDRFENECMIFKSRDKQVVDWIELYSSFDIPVSESSLRVCIEEFIEMLDNGLINED